MWSRRRKVKVRLPRGDGEREESGQLLAKEIKKEWEADCPQPAGRKKYREKEMGSGGEMLAAQAGRGKKGPAPRVESDRKRKINK